MSKMWVIIKREYAQVVKKKSFIVGILLTPIFMAAITIMPAMLASKKADDTHKMAVIEMDDKKIGEKFAESLTQYTLDNDLPAYEVTGIFNINADDTAKLAEQRSILDSLVRGKEIKSYLVINSNAAENDSIILVAKSFGFRTNSRFEKRLSDILSGIRLNKSEVNLEIDSILNLTRRIDISQQAPGGLERDFMTMYMGGIVFVMIIFMTIITYGQVLMRSIIEEKNSRIIEVMISSVSPFQLMAGKIIGLGLANLTQVGIWIVIGLGIYSFRGDLNISADVTATLFNPVFLLFFLVYMFIGYIMYSTLFALIGSIVNTDKEAQNFIFPITMALILPVMTAMYIIQEPDSVLTVTMSLIPIFTPTLMILRMNFIGVEAFTFANPIILEATIGVIITSLTTLLIIWLTSKIFRIGILMYGKRPTLPEIIKWMRIK
ncbi:MAG: ABC transporter permease [candidate division Zixibacteria bacterium]|nr:ABC transporter permease [candidate division Zixibacteria bacterium]